MIDISTFAVRSKQSPPRIFLYAPHGVGKTTFAAHCPDPVFILTEDGLGLLQVPSTPVLTEYNEALEAIGALIDSDHAFKTVVIDSVDWLETLVIKHIESTHDEKQLAYGKGAMLAAECWRDILSGLDVLRRDKNMMVVLLGHSEIKRFDSPEVTPYERYQPKLQARSSALVQEWCDCVLFATYKTYIQQSDVGFNKTVARGISTGDRIMYTSERPAYLAKNRYGLAHELPLSWAELGSLIAGDGLPF